MYLNYKLRIFFYFKVIIFFLLINTYAFAGPWIPNKLEFFFYNFYKSKNEKLLNDMTKEEINILSQKNIEEKKMDEHIILIKKFLENQYSFDKTGVNLLIQLPLSEIFSFNINNYTEKNLNIINIKNKFLVIENPIIISIFLPIVELISDKRFINLKNQIPNDEDQINDDIKIDQADESLKNEVHLISDIITNKSKDNMMYGLGISFGKNFDKKYYYFDFMLTKNDSKGKLILEIGHSNTIISSEVLDFTFSTCFIGELETKSNNFLDIINIFIYKIGNSFKLFKPRSIKQSLIMEDASFKKFFKQEVMLKLKPINTSIFLSIAVEKVDDIEINKVYGVGFSVVF